MRSPFAPRPRGSLLFGLFAAGAGLAAAYLFSKPKLRKELSKADSAKEAIDIVGKHVREDSKEFTEDVREFVKQPHVQSRLEEAKRYFQGKKQEAAEVIEDEAQDVARRAEAAKSKALSKAKQIKEAVVEEKA